MRQHALVRRLDRQVPAIDVFSSRGFLNGGMFPVKQVAQNTPEIAVDMKNGPARGPLF